MRNPRRDAVLDAVRAEFDRALRADRSALLIAALQVVNAVWFAVRPARLAQGARSRRFGHAVSGRSHQRHRPAIARAAGGRLGCRALPRAGAARSHSRRRVQQALRQGGLRLVAAHRYGVLSGYPGSSRPLHSGSGRPNSRCCATRAGGTRPTAVMCCPEWKAAKLTLAARSGGSSPEVACPIRLADLGIYYRHKT